MSVECKTPHHTGCACHEAKVEAMREAIAGWPHIPCAPTCWMETYGDSRCFCGSYEINEKRKAARSAAGLDPNGMSVFAETMNKGHKDA